MKSRSALRLGCVDGECRHIGLIGATLLGSIPYLDRALYKSMHIDLLDGLYPGWMLMLFMILGAMAGAIFKRGGVYGGFVSCVFGLLLLTGIGFIGRHGGDGNFFYAYAVLGSTVFIGSSVAALPIRKYLVRSKDYSR